jgi:murein DD-endopeptidase MepM/ murein hydrolase activator NlpD
MLKTLVVVVALGLGLSGCTGPNVYNKYLQPYASGGLHTGIDIDGHVGQAVIAPRAGRVVWSQPNDGSVGARVTLEHTQGATTVQTQYYHLADPVVSTGDRVTQGQIIARLALTGTRGPYDLRTIERPHLHLEVSVDGRKQDPESLNFQCKTKDRPEVEWQWPVGC